MRRTLPTYTTRSTTCSGDAASSSTTSRRFWNLQHSGRSRPMPWANPIVVFRHPNLALSSICLWWLWRKRESLWFWRAMRKTVRSIQGARYEFISFLTLYFSGFFFPDVCTLPYDSGPCHGSFRKWYYEPQVRECREFQYGGCEGNSNRFSSGAECETLCLHREEVIPRTNETSISHHGMLGTWELACMVIWNFPSI